jgi:hypothetical protein
MHKQAIPILENASLPLHISGVSGSQGHGVLKIAQRVGQIIPTDPKFAQLHLPGWFASVFIARDSRGNFAGESNPDRERLQN